MAKITFDTNFIIQNELLDIPDNFLLSDVVMLELIGSASDSSAFKMYQNLRKEYEADGTLITVNSDDWAMAGKTIYRIEQDTRKHYKGKALPKKVGAMQRMVLDVLLAVSARRFGVAVVTNNWTDFKVIKNFYNFKLVKGSDFLS